jgi:hypothetical protein
MIRHKLLCLVSLCAACGDGGAKGLVPGEEIAALSAQQLSGPCAGTVDLGGDGSVDQRWSFAYTNGGLHEDDLLADVNGTVVETSSFDIDHAGRLVSFVDTYAGTKSAGDWQYDSFGRLLRTGSDGEGDGVDDYVETVLTWTGAGQPLTSSVVQTDVEPSTLIYSYDADGRLAERVVERTADGTLVSRTTVVYDDVAGTRTRTRTYSDSNRTFVRLSRFVDGQLVGFEFWSTGDPDPVTSSFSYDWDGDRLRREVLKFTLAGQTTIDHVTDYSYGCR